MAENLYSCGCHEVDGVLAVKCSPPQTCFRPAPLAPGPEPEKTDGKKRKSPELVNDSE